VKVRRALISVSDKTGVVDFARGLAAMGVDILSTGGTASALREAGIEVTDVSEFTGSPEILGGRVKTLHPRLHAAVLAKRDDPEHMATLEKEGIEPIDLLCVNLYPFEQTVAKPDVTELEGIENIDVGGPTMIRAAAKNHRHVAIVVAPESYDAVLQEMEGSEGEIGAETLHWLANEAFALTARYDAAISRWFGARYETFPGHWISSHDKFLDLPYGENPHQRAALYVDSGANHLLSGVAKHHGKDLSFNNLLDLDAADRLLDEFDEPAAVIIKHNNPCGAAIGETIGEAYGKALDCDPLSAFGGVFALNRPVDTELAERLSKMFIEVLIAPGFEADALEILQRKEAVRILEQCEPRPRNVKALDFKRISGGVLVQDADVVEVDQELMEIATETGPDERQWKDLLFAWKVCRQVRSNAIVFAKDGATIGIGAGQMSRVDAVRIAIDKARSARGENASDLLSGAAVASDAFFPFADGPQAAIEAGASAFIQPGGSKRDQESVQVCDAAGATMVFTGRRHFRH